MILYNEDILDILDQADMMKSHGECYHNILRAYEEGLSPCSITYLINAYLTEVPNQ